MSPAEDGENGQGATGWTVETASAAESLDRSRLARVFARVALNRLVDRRLLDGGWAGPCSSNRVSSEDLSTSPPEPS